MMNYVVLRPGFNFWMQEHLWSQPREKRALHTAAAFAIAKRTFSDAMPDPETAHPSRPENRHRVGGDTGLDHGQRVLNRAI